MTDTPITADELAAQLRCKPKTVYGWVKDGLIPYQKIGGWNSMDMVMRYAHLAPDHVAQYANNSKAR